MRLIDADKLDWWYKGRNIRHIIDDAPTVDAVVVTRCKDCKYADDEKQSIVEKQYMGDLLFCRNSYLCGDEPLSMWPNDFCSYGKRRDGGASNA